jgi:hypothetical protein
MDFHLNWVQNLTNEAGKLDRFHPLAKGKTSYAQNL